MGNHPDGPMDILSVALAALLASGLTMFSGFGLGTLLMPVLALFLPVDLAVAATAIVHAANNVWKVSLLGRHAERAVVLRFGLPAIVAAFAGAALLGALGVMPELARYDLLGRAAVVTPLKLVLALLMVGFALFELVPTLERWQVDARWLPVGGLLSGFFGGLSGHQGALRSAFLARISAEPKAFVGTNAVIGLMVDVARLSLYGALLIGPHWDELSGGREGVLVLSGALAAFAGVLLGKRLLHKVTMRAVQQVTGTLLLLIAIALGLGVV